MLGINEVNLILLLALACLVGLPFLVVWANRRREEAARAGRRRPVSRWYPFSGLISVPFIIAFFALVDPTRLPLAIIASATEAGWFLLFGSWELWRSRRRSRCRVAPVHQHVVGSALDRD